MPRCKLRLATTKNTCEMRLHVFYMHVLPHRTWHLLRIVQQGRNMKSRSHPVLTHNPNRLYGICLSLRTNVVLSRHRNYKPSIRHPIHGNDNSPMIMRRILRRQSNPDPIFCIPLPLSFYYNCSCYYTPFFLTQKRSKKSGWIKKKLRQDAISYLLHNKGCSRLRNSNGGCICISNAIPRRPKRPRKLYTSKPPGNTPSYSARMIFSIRLCHTTIHT